jgi:hypothetical protein
MRNDDIRYQLEALRTEVRALNNAFIDLRRDEVKRVFCDQIRPVLVERIDRFAYKNREDEQSEIGDMAEHVSILTSLVDGAISQYEQGGKEEATGFLDEYESKLGHQRFSKSHPDATKFALDLIEELRGYFETSEAVLRQSISSGTLLGPPVNIKKAELSPIRAEKALAPLANSWRITVLLMLSKDDESLVGLCRKLGLKKGHLQFHLDNLLDSKYIQYDRKGHLYSLTPQGTIVLDEVTKLIDRLTSIEG